MCRRPSGTEWPAYPGPGSKFTQTQLILHPQAPPWGRNSGQQDTPSTTVKERKVALNFLLPLLLFLPYMSPTSSSFREYSECPIYLPGCTQLSWEAGWGEFETAGCRLGASLPNCEASLHSSGTLSFCSGAHLQESS